MNVFYLRLHECYFPRFFDFYFSIIEAFPDESRKHFFFVENTFTDRHLNNRVFRYIIKIFQRDTEGC